MSGGETDQRIDSCDDPHPVRSWPQSRAAIVRAMGARGSELVAKITGHRGRKL